MSPSERAAVDQAHRQFGEPTATTKPRAGEQADERIAELEEVKRAHIRDIHSLWAERDSLAAQLATCKAAHMSNCLDADKLRTRIAELREVLEHVCDTISGPAPAIRRAREILAKHGR